MEKSEAMRLAGGLAFKEKEGVSLRVKRAHKRRFFRELAESWDLWYGLFYHNDPPGMTRGEYETVTEKEAARLLPWLSPSSSVLDLGCGDGRILRLLSPHCASARGADISPAALSQARRLCRGLANVGFRLVVDETLPFPDAAFDLVYCHLMLSHLDLEPAIACLRESARVLKPGGRFVFDLPNLFDPENLGCLLAPERTNWPGINRPRFWTEEMVRGVVPRLGLRVESLDAGRWFEVCAVKI